jgi:hypothetical protein
MHAVDHSVIEFERLGQDTTDPVAQPFPLNWVFGRLIKLSEEFDKDFGCDCRVHLC